MIRWIRWQGLIAFTLLCLILAFLWFVVADWLVEKGIESAGSRALGAKVEVANADLTLFPAGVTLHGLAITDPNQPMRNALEVGRLHAALEWLPLIKRKVIINDMSVEGLRVNTQRQTSGALKGVATSEKSDAKPPSWFSNLCGDTALPSLHLPTVNEILSREPLQSLQMAQELKTEIAAAQTQWQTRLDALPNEKQLGLYRNRIDKIKGAQSGLGGLLGSASEAQSVVNDLQKDLKQIKEAQASFQSQYNDLQKAGAELARAPKAEAKRLTEKYTVTPAGMANLSRLLFGGQVCGWWQDGYVWYQRLSPYLSQASAPSGAATQSQPLRGKGVDVHFKEKNPLPEFLIRNIHIDAQLEMGEFTGQITHITNQPPVLGLPTTYKFLGRNMKQMAAFNLMGTLNMVQPQANQHHAKMDIKQWSFQDLLLGNTDRLPITINKGITDMHLQFNVDSDRVNALLKATLDHVQMELRQEASSTLMSALASTIKATERFGISAKIQGKAPELRAQLSSDLDRILEKTTGRLVKKSSQALAAQLQQALTDRTQGPIGSTQSGLADLENISKQLTQRLKVGNNLAQQAKQPY